MPPAVSSYEEAEIRFERWLKKYQSDRTAHEKARNAHHDPAYLDAHFAAVVEAMDLSQCHNKPTELALATEILLNGARASTHHFPNYEVATNLGDLVDTLEEQVDDQCRGRGRVVPELGAFLDALTGSGSAAVLTNRQCAGIGGEPLPYLVLQLVMTGHPWGQFRLPGPVELGSPENRALRRVCLRFLARMAFLRAEQTLGEEGTHPFVGLLGVARGEPYERGLHPLKELAIRHLNNRTNQAAVLQVVYLMMFVYRAFPWPRRQHLADSVYAESAPYAGWWWYASNIAGTAMEIAVIVPGVFQAFVNQKLEHLLLDVSHTSTMRKRRGNCCNGILVFAWNRCFEDRRAEGRLVAMLRDNRLLSGRVCKAGRSLLLEICRQRRRRVVEAVAQGAPFDFAAAVPELLAFVRGPGVRGKKGRLVAWLETKLENSASRNGLGSALRCKDDPSARGR